MAITDNLVYRLKAKLGDTTPLNEVTGSGAVAGGTFSLVDRGSGDCAWQFTAGDSTASLTSRSPGTSTGDGVTMAITLKVVTGPTVDFTRYCGYSNSALTEGLFVSQNGANAVRARFQPASGGVNAAFSGVGTTEFTFVFRVKTPSSGNATIEGWKQTTGRVGTTPDSAAASTATVPSALNTVFIRQAASGVIQIKDWVIWHRELTDTECANVADGLRATVDALPSPVATLAWTEANDTTVISTTVVPTATVAYTEANDVSAVVGNVTITGVAGAISYTEANDTTAITGSVTAVTGTITTGAFENNTGSILASLTGLTVTVLNLATLAFVKTFTSKTTNASGIMTLNDALLVAGTQYAVVTANASGVLGVEKYTAA